MSVRKNHRDKWLIDIKYEDDSGRVTRVRKTADVQTRRAAEAEERDIRQALKEGTYQASPEEVGALDDFHPPTASGRGDSASVPVPSAVARSTAASAPQRSTIEGPKEATLVAAPQGPTVASYARDFISTSELTDEKQSSLESKESHLRAHLIPLFGDQPLDAFKFNDWAKLRTWLRDKQQKRRALEDAKRKAKGKPPKSDPLSNGISTFNNVASTLNAMIELAGKQQLISKEAYRFTLIPRQDEMVEFYDFEEFEELVYAAREHSALAEVIVLLGGESGLRRCEMYPLLWSSCHLPLRQMTIYQAEVMVKRDRSPEQTRALGPTKTKVNRVVRMTDRVLEALQRLRREQGQKGGRVLLRPNGSPFTDHPFRDFLIEVQERARLPATGNVHILRHTFCSHLAMKGAPLSSIQKAAGHSNIRTTMKYIHLIPNEVDKAIDALNDRSDKLGAGWKPRRLRESGEEAAE